MKIVNKAGETEILIYEDIGDGWFGGVSAKSVIKALKDAPKGNAILIRINSPGGNVFEGMAIYNAIKGMDREIATQVDGMAFSAASYIFMASETRKMAENAFLMIHEGWGVAIGTADEMSAMADMLREVNHNIAQIYADATGQGRSDIDGWMADETFFTVNPEGDAVLDAIELGFATEVIENLKVAAHFDPQRYHLKNVPQELASLVDGPDTAARANVARMDQRLSRRGLKA